MSQQNNRFVSYIESQIQEQGELYARFHLGNFVAGQALTVANALRRTLLAEIPGLVITSLEIEGAQHEFATLPGVQENVLNILLNIKRLALTATKTDLAQIALERQELVASINGNGPKILTASDIKFPAGITPVYPQQQIANLGSIGKLKMNLNLQFIDPLKMDDISKISVNFDSKKLVVNTKPNSVRKVNYSIRPYESGTGEEYISLEIWTDGSLDPKNALDYALERLTIMFYEFTTLNKKVVHSIQN